MGNKSCISGRRAVAEEFKSEDSWAELLLDAKIKLAAAAAE